MAVQRGSLGKSLTTARLRVRLQLARGRWRALRRHVSNGEDAGHPPFPPLPEPSREPAPDTAGGGEIDTPATGASRNGRPERRAWVRYPCVLAASGQLSTPS